MKKKAKAEKKAEMKAGRDAWYRRAFAVTILLTVGVVVLVVGRRESADPGQEVSSSPPPSSRSTPNVRIPPFHEDASTAKPFPETLSPSLFENAVVARAYQVAGEIPEVLAQQPCYCFCQGHGHGSLLDCYTDYHGAG
jgi:hypothetical protein